MVDMEKLIKFSKKTEVEIKKEIEEGMKRLVEIKGMSDPDKLVFVMNELFAKYSKERFSSGSGQQITAFIIGSYNKSDNVEYLLKEIKEFVEKQPDKAKELCMIDSNGNYLFYETQDKFSEMQDWQIKKRFREASNDENAILTKNGKRYIGLPIPKHDYVKYVHGFEITKDNAYIPFVMKLAHTVNNDEDNKLDNTESELPTLQVGTFNVYKVESMSSDNFSYFTGSGRFEFKFVRALNDEEIENCIATQIDKIIPLSNFNMVDGTIKRNSYAIFKVRVQDIGILDNGGYVFKVYDDTIELGDDDSEGNKIVPFTVYPQEGYKPTFSDGAEIYVFGNPYTSNRGVKTISACGIYVSSIYKNLVQATVQNIDL